MDSRNDVPTMPLGELLPAIATDTALSKALQTIEGHQDGVSRQLTEFFGRHKSWLDRFFPTELDVVLKDGQLNLARTQSELTNRVMQIAGDVKIRACEEAGEAWLRGFTAEVRETMYGSLCDQIAELQKAVDERRLQFAEHLEKRFANAERFKHQPKFYALYLKSIDDELERYLPWLDTLVTEFCAIGQQRIAQYK